MKRNSYGLALAAFLFGSQAAAQTPADLGADDRSAIQALVTAYAQALGACSAEEFADLFVPETGYFASGFRGHFVGHDRLIALVQSEPQCTSASGRAPAVRRAANGPTVELAVTPNGVRGIADLGAAEYQDEYTKTAQGWRFASRTVIIAAEKAAGLDASDLLAIHRLGGSKLGDHYVADDNGVPRLLNSGVSISVSGDEIAGRAYLKDGGYNDEVYEEVGTGQWRVKSSSYVPPETR